MTTSIEMKAEMKWQTDKENTTERENKCFKAVKYDEPNDELKIATLNT